MDYENRYRDALERAKKLHKDAITLQLEQDIKDYEYIFPELKESEGERIRKEIIYHIQNCDDTIDEVTEKRMIASLEKQGDIDRRIQEEIKKQTKQQWKSKKQGVNVSGECNDTALEEQLKIWFEKGKCSGIDDVIFHPQKYGLEKQGEQKQDPCEKCDHFTLNCHNFPCIKKKAFDQGKSALEAVKEEKVDNANKVEPKFKVGDWVVYCNEDVDLITGIEENGYCINNGGYIPFVCASDIRLWTIQDAKDGDVLSDGTTIFIFKDLLSDGSVMSYCDYDTDSGENDDFCPLSVNLMCSKITPATREQRELLFQKMKEAGYEWNAAKKELKMIHVIDEGKAEMDYCFTKMMNGEKVSSAWSEEDERNLQGVIDEIEANKNQAPDCDLAAYDRFLSWLKSLKERMHPQWKPNEEHISRLETAINYLDSIGAESSKIVLKNLLEQLKKL